jgi:type IV secretory pathway VirD2 relaxase
MDDETGTKMCDACADDCMDSGLFYTNESQALTLVKALLDRGLTISEALKPMANAKASKKEWSDGIKVEREHATTTTTAKIIASHHLKEKPDYYKRLKKAGLADELK